MPAKRRIRKFEFDPSSLPPEDPTVPPQSLLDNYPPYARSTVEERFSQLRTRYLPSRLGGTFTFRTPEDRLEDIYIDALAIRQCVKQVVDLLLPFPLRLNFCFGIFFVTGQDEETEFGFYYGSNNCCFLSKPAFISSPQDLQITLENITEPAVRDHCDLILDDSELRFHSIACVKVNAYMIPELNTQ